MRAILRAMLLIAAVTLATGSWAIDVKLESGSDPKQRAGSFELDGVKYRIQIKDILVNGRFDDFLTKIDPRSAETGMVSARADMVMLSRSGVALGDQQHLGRFLLIRDKLFAVKFDKDCTTLTLDPAEGVAATLPRGVIMADLIDEQSGSSITIYDAVEKVKLPAGNFRLISYSMDRQDEQGDHWFANAYGSMKQPPYNIDAATSSTLAFGEPFTTRVQLDTNTEKGWFSDTLVAQMNFTIYDNAGARVGALYHFGNKTKIPLKNGKPMNPTWRAVTAEGEKAGSGSFEYG